MSGKDSIGVIVGGEPRIDLLPVEIKESKQARKTRRALAGLVIVVFVVVAGAYVFASTLTVDAQNRLAAEQEKTQALLQEQTQYAEARTVAGQAAVTQNARVVGSATEIDWRKFLSSVQATLPAGLYVQDFSIEGQNPFDAATVPDKLLQENRIASMSITGISTGLGQAAQWLVALEKLPGFADVAVNTVTLDEATRLYEVSIVFNISTEVLERRYLENTAGTIESATAGETEPDEDAPEGN